MCKYDTSIWIIPYTGKNLGSTQIEDFIIDRIKNRIVQPKQSIPSHRTIAKLNNVNKNTVARAFTKLIITGWLTHSKGSKSFVADLKKNEGTQSSRPSMPNILPSALPLLQHWPDDNRGKHLTNFISVGTPSIEDVAYRLAGTKKPSRDELGTNGQSSYGREIKREEKMTLHEAVLKHLQARGFNLMTNHLAIVRGRNECLRSIFKLFSLSKDIIINTAPDDPLINFIIYDDGIRTINLDVTGHNLIKRLQSLVQKNKISAIYLRTNCSYPKCISLDEATCQALITIAKQHKIYIIEEDDDHEFWWNRYPYKALAKYDHEGYVIYCAALSRLSPYLQHLRTVVAPSQFIGLLGSVDAGLGYKNYMEEKKIIGLLSNHGLLMLSRKARHAKQKDLKRADEILQLQLGRYISYELPECGLGLWIELPVSTNLVRSFESAEFRKIEIKYRYKLKSGQTVQYMYLDLTRFDENLYLQIAAKFRSLLNKKSIGNYH